MFQIRSRTKARGVLTQHEEGSSERGILRYSETSQWKSDRQEKAANRLSTWRESTANLEFSPGKTIFQI